MTRMDSVRAATDSAKESVLHAADVVAPYAGAAREQAALYAREARVRMAPKVSEAARQARVHYGAYVAPHVPPKLDAAAQRAAYRTRRAARQAASYTAPRLEQVMAAAEPARQEAVSRSVAALAALRGQVTAEEVRKLVRRHERRARNRRVLRGVAVLGMVLGGAVAVWKWWEGQAEPDWLAEPPTEVSEGPVLTSVDGSEPASVGTETAEGRGTPERPGTFEAEGPEEDDGLR
ncbi:DUF5324 family protein [Streptomyces somaliensis DSM 40738]|uniref:DUF5324 family protein n=1 Tax=Streptomyces somaliensis (strain ATCC 33201 / DSM 40738 / JCM 12659 / KCTC 9044 / NCTC 11332 / NRRL B-12077 / IP 733) TaxID=1134445 RepID=A0AA44IEQ9_STRE0|nr:DUF5324 family protein [Streptomyces somaliensis]MCQ0024757.1 DUF5324 family protein [Streptomyces somaliensis DSM 40738]NKY15608.1 DUF5324 family protein [Streptomyces somaliensis DSM 40738]